MVVKIITGLIAMSLVIIYVAAPAYKLKDVALVIVISIGVVMMLVDLWQSLREKE
jgi:uncharacterized membrane protein YqjE